MPDFEIFFGYIKSGQMVLLAKDNKESREFYESLGFESCDKRRLVAFVKLKTEEESKGQR